MPWQEGFIDQKGYCCRYPERKEMRYDDYCGDFTMNRPGYFMDLFMRMHRSSTTFGILKAELKEAKAKLKELRKQRRLDSAA